MRTTITLDDKLLEDAKDAAGVAETSAVVKLALTALVQREAARRLAAMGGAFPDIQYVRRRRPDDQE
jgi:Arc/MetJ family transcription regulator